jgi:hypothetical protein
VGNAKKRTGHVYEKAHPIASESDRINQDRLGKTPKMLLAMIVMTCHTFRSTELQTEWLLMQPALNAPPIQILPDSMTTNTKLPQ